MSREIPEPAPGVRLARHESLVPLSRDHHDVLVHSLELRRSAESGDVDRLSAAKEVAEAERGPEAVAPSKNCTKLSIYPANPMCWSVTSSATCSANFIWPCT